MPSRRTLLTFASGLLLASSVPWMLASCATTVDFTPQSDASTRLDATLAFDTGDGNVPIDGGCDASDPNCVAKPIGCDEAEWCPVPTNVSTFYALVRVWGTGPNDVWATGSGATVIHWDGTVWAPTPVPSPDPVPLKDTFRALWASGPNDVWIASTTDRIFHSDGFKNGTATWELTPSASEADLDRGTLLAAWGTSPDDVRFGGSSRHRAEDGQLSNQVVRVPSGKGIDWRRELGTFTINAFWGTSANDVWVVADNRPYFPQTVGMILHGTRSAGETDFGWQEIDSRTEIVLRGIWGSSNGDVWAVGDNGTVRHFGPDPKAVEFAIVDVPTKENLHGVWSSGPNDVWIIGESGTILHWDGAEWRESVAAFPAYRNKPDLYSIWGSGPKDVWIVGNDIALHYGTTGGTK